LPVCIAGSSLVCCVCLSSGFEDKVCLLLLTSLSFLFAYFFYYCDFILVYLSERFVWIMLILVRSVVCFASSLSYIMPFICSGYFKKLRSEDIKILP